MIKINCETKDKLKLTEMVPFQGNLKKRTPQDIAALKDSLLKEGLMMPFAIWKKQGQEPNEQSMYLLDGHGRKQALVEMAVENPELLNCKWPVIYVQAETEDDARKALLQITSQYGKITKSGVKQFCVSIPDYKAPAIAKFIAKPTKAKESEPKVTELKVTKTVIRIKVDKERVDELKNVLKEFKWIEVL